jgi:hypothetical protein
MSLSTSWKRSGEKRREEGRGGERGEEGRGESRFKPEIIMAEIFRRCYI